MVVRIRERYRNEAKKKREKNEKKNIFKTKRRMRKNIYSLKKKCIIPVFFFQRENHKVEIELIDFDALSGHHEKLLGR